MMSQSQSKSQPRSRPTPSNNPVLLLSSFPPLSETSLIAQTKTVLTLTGQHTSLLHDFQAIGNQFALIVNVVIYSPNQAFQPMAVMDTVTDSSGIPQNRLYHQAFQFGFGPNNNGFQHAMFYLTNLPPLVGDLTLTVRHPACQRRIVTVDQFANLTANPLDQQAAQQSQQPGIIQISSGLTAETSQRFELIYGSVAIGRDFDQYNDPQGFIPIQSIGSNIDSFDATLKTYYKLSATQGQFGLNALVSNSNQNDQNFVWSAAVQTFDALQL